MPDDVRRALPCLSCTCGGQRLRRWVPAGPGGSDLYGCDHFVEPDYRLGNIQETPMVASERQRQFGQAKLDTLPQYCRDCTVRFACNGGCPKNRFAETPDGEPGLNYLCAGYKAFFTHIDKSMRLMADFLRQGGYADEVMGLLAKETKRKPGSGGNHRQKPAGFGTSTKL